MLWSLVKVIVFVGLAIALSFGLSYIMETPGEVRIAFGGREISLAPIGFIVMVVLALLVFWLLLKLSGLLVATLRFLNGDETALSRFWGRKRERRGYDALAESMIALAAGEGTTAQAKAAKAERLLKRPELTRLINAQASEMAGDHKKALFHYKELLGDERTRFVGIKGILKQKLAEGDTDTALKLAEKAYALRPRHNETLDTLFALQSEKSDWSGARQTLVAKQRAKALPKDVAKRREAVLLLADAKTALDAGDDTAARTAALAANKLSPTLVPAAVLAARILASEGAKRQATKILKAVWQQAPHPDIATAFAALEPDEAIAARRKRFAPLIRMHPDHPETAMLLTELALAEGDFPEARRALGDLAETRPTTRTLALMAAIEKGSGGDDSLVRAFLAKALSASRGDQWVCSSCGHAHAQWRPACENCAAFDTLEWKEPPASTADAPMDAVLPMIIGTGPDPEPQDIAAEDTPDTAPAESGAEPAEPEIIDAEVTADKPA